MKIMRSIAIMLTFGTFYCYGGGLKHFLRHLFVKESSLETKERKKQERMDAVRRNQEARLESKEPSKKDIKKEEKAIKEWKEEKQKS